jgi:hypothetical protein
MPDMSELLSSMRSLGLSEADIMDAFRDPGTFLNALGTPTEGASSFPPADTTSGSEPPPRQIREIDESRRRWEAERCAVPIKTVPLTRDQVLDGFFPDLPRPKLHEVMSYVTTVGHQVSFSQTPLSELKPSEYTLTPLNNNHNTKHF